MHAVYLIRNQHNHYLAKDGTWQPATQYRKLYFSQHQDEALNTLLETNSKHIELRMSLEQATLNDKRLPVLTKPEISACER